MKYNFFLAGFSGAAGALMFFLTITLYTIIVAGSGLYLILKYNLKEKDGKHTPYFKQMTGPQYFGIFLLVLGLLPHLDTMLKSILWYFSQGVGLNMYNTLFGE